MARHEGICWWLAERFGRGLRPADLEDLAAVARAQLVRASRTYEPSRGVQFSTYAVRAAGGQVRRAAAGIRAGGLVGLPVCRSPEMGLPIVGALDAVIPDTDELRFEELYALPAAELPPQIPADFWDRVESVLTGRHRECLLMRYREERKLQEIADRVGGTRQAVQQTILVALRKLRASGLFDGLRYEI